ncbi:uncharacterized protein GO595_010311 [Histomonas meleagridis]|uniref:uncharacterized protein n=1 Tax=Histomonas meleagridis TaxID=135588 RepID=UPI00355AB3BC|nr:hypothetical protein GO595_010311 [Histomonas meleagridis]
MSLFKSFWGFVSDFEKSIDKDFAERNNVERKEENQQGKEERQISEGNKNVQEEDTKNDKAKDIIKGREEEDIDYSTRIQELQNKVADFELEVEENTKTIENYQNILNTVDPNWTLLIQEYQERNRKITEQKEKLQRNIEQIKEEIEQFSNNNEILRKVEEELSSAREKSGLIQEEYKNIQIQEETLQKEEKRLDEELLTTEKELQNVKNDIKDTNQNIQEEERKYQISKRQFEQNKKEIIELSIQNDKYYQEYEEQRKIYENVHQEEEKLHKDIERSKTELYNIDQHQQNYKEKRRKMRSESIRQLANGILQSKEKERNELIHERDKLNEKKTFNQNAFEREHHNIQLMISSSKTEHRELLLRYNNIKSSIPQLIEPLQTQIESFKSVYATNESIEMSVLERLTTEYKELEEQHEAQENAKKDISRELEEINSEKRRLQILYHSLEEEIQTHRNNIETMKGIIEEYQSKTYDIKYQYERTKEKYF